MGQKIHPNLYRLGVNRETESIWFAQGSNYADLLHEDFMIRNYLRKRFAESEERAEDGAIKKIPDKKVSKIKIFRKSNSIQIDIYTAMPGQVIGQKGAEIEKLRAEMNKLINKNRPNPITVSINVNMIDKPWLDSYLVGKEIAKQLESRVSFRRAMKRSMSNVMKEGALGVKVQVSGRLGGAEIARTERYKEGRTPLHTLRADIDYAHVEANTTYGIIGIKVWIYKGDIL